jgi:hypothetical protein
MLAKSSREVSKGTRIGDDSVLVKELVYGNIRLEGLCEEKHCWTTFATWYSRNWDGDRIGLILMIVSGYGDLKDVDDPLWVAQTELGGE